jgi:manganese-dependent ADP-ribose/CDP-alcohol diphosphatase
MSRDHGNLSRREFLRTSAGLAASTCLVAGCGSQVVPDEPLRFGVVTDVQYADADPKGPRIFRGSPKKLKAAVADFNTMNLDFVINLGDLIDRDFFSFDTMMPIMGTINAPVAHVLGNHDYEVADVMKASVPERLGMSTKHYDFVMGNWRFVVLDGNELSLHAHIKDSEVYRKSALLLEELKAQNKHNAKPWNGAMGREQLNWLSSRLAMATKAHQKVIVFCHWPIFPEALDTLWNAEALLEVLESSDCVAAYFNGHHHAGGYGEKKGIHYVTFRGMVDGAERTSYSTVECTSNRIEITGYGDEPSRSLI